MNCATCKSWAIKTSPLRAQSMAPCLRGNCWEALPPQSSCRAYTALDEPLFASRAAWFKRLMTKTKVN
jgi:hypothetical protein